MKSDAAKIYELYVENAAKQEPTMTLTPEGDKEWRLHGKLHREDGPAVEYANGSKKWYLHGKLHREDGPAIDMDNGTKMWFLHGALHREDGPAVEWWLDGAKEWYLHGKEYRDATTWAQATLKHQNKLHDDMSIEVFLRKVLVKNSVDLL
jgi:hypothetical protein